jgi:ABC-type polysaccharide/polyol phosphate export permease
MPRKEFSVNRNIWIRQAHRWVSMAFTISVIIVTVVILTQEQPAEWVYLSPLLPLALLLLTGLYLFALPYLSGRRGGQHAIRDA